MPTTHTIRNKGKFLKYTEEEQGIFEAFREAQLSMCTIWEKDYDQEDLDLTERAAFIFVDMYPKVLKEPPPPPSTTGPGGIL